MQWPAMSAAKIQKALQYKTARKVIDRLGRLTLCAYWTFSRLACLSPESPRRL